MAFLVCNPAKKHFAKMILMNYAEFYFYFTKSYKKKFDEFGSVYSKGRKQMGGVKLVQRDANNKCCEARENRWRRFQYSCWATGAFSL
jgi:hypothetical protein